MSSEFTNSSCESSPDESDRTGATKSTIKKPANPKPAFPKGSQASLSQPTPNQMTNYVKSPFFVAPSAVKCGSDSGFSISQGSTSSLLSRHPNEIIFDTVKYHNLQNGNRQLQNAVKGLESRVTEIITSKLDNIAQMLDKLKQDKGLENEERVVKIQVVHQSVQTDEEPKNLQLTPVPESRLRSLDFYTTNMSKASQDHDQFHRENNVPEGTFSQSYFRQYSQTQKQYPKIARKSLDDRSSQLDGRFTHHDYDESIESGSEERFETSSGSYEDMSDEDLSDNDGTQSSFESVSQASQVDDINRGYESETNNASADLSWVYFSEDESSQDDWF